MLLILSMIVLVLGLVICESAKCMLHSPAWKKLLAIFGGSGLAGTGAWMFGMAVGIV